MFDEWRVGGGGGQDFRDGEWMKSINGWQINHVAMANGFKMDRHGWDGR